MFRVELIDCIGQCWVNAGLPPCTLPLLATQLRVGCPLIAAGPVIPAL
jgi:hypothetical protein